MKTHDGKKNVHAWNGIQEKRTNLKLGSTREKIFLRKKILLNLFLFHSVSDIFLFKDAKLEQ